MNYSPLQAHEYEIFGLIITKLSCYPDELYFNSGEGIDYVGIEVDTATLLDYFNGFIMAEGWFVDTSGYECIINIRDGHQSC